MSPKPETKMYYLSKKEIGSACEEHWLRGGIKSRLVWDVIIGTVNTLYSVTPAWEINSLEMSPPDLFSGIEHVLDYTRENALIVNGICVHEWNCSEDVTSKFSIE